MESKINYLRVYKTIKSFNITFPKRIFPLFFLTVGFVNNTLMQLYLLIMYLSCIMHGMCDGPKSSIKKVDSPLEIDDVMKLKEDVN